MSIDIEREYIFSIYLSFDLMNMFVYPIIYMMESWMVTCSVLYIVCTELIFASLVVIVAMELDILGHKISEIIVDDAEEEAIKELKKIVDIHQELIEASDKINEIFSFLLFCNTFVSITSLCTACFLSMVFI